MVHSSSIRLVPKEVRLRESPPSETVFFLSDCRGIFAYMFPADASQINEHV